MSIRQYLSDAGVLEIIIDAPPVNAVGLNDLAALSSIVAGVGERPEVRVVILRGEGRGFIGGGDVKEVQRLPGFDGILGQVAGSSALTVAIHECAVPVIAAVHHYCIGLGVLVAGVCDVVVADENCSFVLAEVDNGATTGAIHAMGLMPEKRLRQAMFTGEPVSARELAAYGTVVAVADEHLVLEEARRLATVMTKKVPDVLRAAKRSINGSTRRDLEVLYRQEVAITLDLNMRGHAAQARESVLSGDRVRRNRESGRS
ncbi:enoyl-CoA hydratase-related protein [Rhodococcus sp. NPDC056960]|uniref:enoyl-CoA hydratase-related protein n=1 Tax=Rhodococcus TaxID=1827 RepID=UPI003628341D